MYVKLQLHDTQVDLSARVDGLTHRMSAALSIPSKTPTRGGGVGEHSPRAVASNHPGVVATLSRVSRQLEALVEQHTLLKVRSGDEH